MPPKIYRAPLPSLYIEPDLAPDVLDGMELLYKDYGKSLRKKKTPLPPRDPADILKFDPKLHQKEFDENIKWGDCPMEHRPRITKLIQEYWDIFSRDGLRKHIRGYECRIDTGDIMPICCKVPRYGPHESKVITQLVDALEDKALVEDDDGPWGALVVLAAKANQEHVPWDQYIWRLCVSYRRLNQVTRPYAFPMRRCDDAVADVGPKARFYISVDLDSGFWQVVVEKASRPKLAFFTPKGKKRWTVMPMGALNSTPIFVAMTTDFQAEWDQLARDRGIDPRKVRSVRTGSATPPDLTEAYGSEVIVDDMLWYAEDVDTLFAYFRCALDVLLKYRVTIRLKKCQWLPPTIEFVGIQLGPNGNSPAQSKFPAFAKLPPPNTFGDLRILIGMFGFYQEYIPLFQTRIAPWRKLQAGQPLPGQLKPQDERDFFKGFWLPEHQTLLDELKKELISGLLVMARPNPNRRFYVKTDWSRLAMGAVLMQARDDDKSELAESLEAQGGPCLFELQTNGIRLRPIACISRATSGTETSYHSHTGEASVGLWAFNKWRKYLIGAEFTWIADSQGLKGFFEDDPDKLHTALHVLQRWRAALLMYHFVIEHRPARMLVDCDALSRYNTMTSTWRDNLPENTPRTPAALATPCVSNKGSTFIGHTCLSIPQLPPVMFTKPRTKTRTIPKRINPYIRRSIVTWNSLGTPIYEALTESGILFDTFLQLEDEHTPESIRAYTNTDKFLSLLHQHNPGEIHFDWFIGVCDLTPTLTAETPAQLTAWCTRCISILQILLQHLELSSATMIAPAALFPTMRQVFLKVWNTNPANSWTFSQNTLCGHKTGAPITSEHHVLHLGPLEKGPAWTQIDAKTPMSEGLPKPSSTTLHYCLKNTSLRHASPLDQEVHHAAPAVIKVFTRETLKVPSKEYPLFDPLHPAPSVIHPRMEEPFFHGMFAIHLQSKKRGEERCRVIQSYDYSVLLGADHIHTAALEMLPPTIATTRVRAAMPKQALAVLLRALHCLEEEQQISCNLATLAPTSASTHNKHTNVPTDVFSLIPLPTQTGWANAIQRDHDLRRIYQALTKEAPIPLRTDLNEPVYLDFLQRNQLDAENGMVYFYDNSKTREIRQLKRRVVPKSLRSRVFLACHTSPFAGHSSLTRTLYRLQTRFWWPNMIRDVTIAVKGCLHCSLSNTTSHENQTLLTSITSESPFATVYLDIWSPGDLTDKHGNTKVLTMMDCLTGFVIIAFIRFELNALAIAQAIMERLIGTVGLPHKIVVDSGTEFAGILSQVLEILKIPKEVASPENHRRIRNERFHRLLNKVQTVNTADFGNFFLWLQAAIFAAYAWNSTPTDGTDVPRSVAAIGREFPFPIDISMNQPSPNSGTNDSQQTLDHTEAILPFLKHQRYLLQLLNSDRRKWHADLKNENRKPPSFNPGDIVIVRKQFKSNSTDGTSAKLQFRPKGPYRVLEQISPSSYKIQKLPFLRGLGRPGIPIKENAARMTRLPSTVILHHTPDGADTQFGLLSGLHMDHPLKKWIGVLAPGSYTQAAPNAKHAFIRLHSMWSEQVDPNDSDDDDAPNEDDQRFADNFPARQEEDSDDETFLPNPRRNKHDGQFIEDIDHLDDSPAVPQTAHPQVPTEHATEHTEHATEHRPRKRKRPEGPTPLPADPVIPPAPFPLTPAQITKTTSARNLRHLYHATAKLKVALFFVSAPADPWAKNMDNNLTWQIVQVAPGQIDRNLALSQGIYPIRRLRQNPQHAHTRAIVDSRFFPDMWEWLPDKKKHVQRNVSPEKRAQALQNNTHLIWPTQNIALGQYLIHGPFEFHSLKPPAYLPPGPREPHRIHNTYWTILEDRAKLFGLDVSTIRIPPATSGRLS